MNWPAGRVDVYTELEGDTGYLLREGEATPRALPGFAAQFLAAWRREVSGGIEQRATAPARRYSIRKRLATTRSSRKRSR